MIFIIQTKGFDLENELQSFIERCLQMLVRHPIKISEIKVTIGEGNVNIGKSKFCHVHVITSHANYSITQYGNSYEEAVLCSVKELELKVKKI